MKPVAFEYVAPTSVEETLSVLAQHGDDAKLLAGGQSLIPFLTRRIVRPAVVVDINRLGELSHIHSNGDLVLGALVRQRVAERSEVVGAFAPLLVEGIRTVAHPPVRARGTVVGSLAHGDPGAQIATIAVALDSQLDVRSARGQRVLAVEDLGAGAYETVLASDEMIVEVRMPAVPDGAGSSFQQVTRRYGHSPMVSVAAVVRLDADGCIAEARLAIGGAGETPVRARIAEVALTGALPTVEVFASAAASMVAELEFWSDLHASSDYRRHAVVVLARRALADAAGRA